jgi:hypothetical protein
MRSDRLVSTITVRPNDVYPIDVMPAQMGENDDTMWIKVTSLPTEGDCNWPWSYGLLTWKTEEGRELGTVKINGVCEGEVFKLGVGRPPLLRSGRLSFEPRSYNLKWIELGHPWTLTFEYSTGITAGGGLLPSEPQATVIVPAIPRGNAQPDFQIEGELARILLNLFFRR